MRRLSLSDVKLSFDVKRANQRLRQLEKSGVAKNNIYYKNLERLEKSGANYLTRTKGRNVRGKETKAGNLKYRTDIGKMSASEKRLLKRNVKIFLESDWTKVKTARKKIAESYEKGYQTIKAQTGTDLTEKEYYDLWAQMSSKSLDKYLSSDQMMEVITTVSKKIEPREIVDALEDMKRENLDYRELIKDKFGLEFDPQTGRVNVQHKNDKFIKDKAKNSILSKSKNIVNKFKKR